MAPTKPLNATNLEALGAPRLVELLLDLTKGNAAAKRQLRLELAAETGTADVVREIRKRRNTIARSRAFVDWPKRKALIADLDAQVQTIRRHVAEHDPKAAFDLMWRFLSPANGIFERCDDSSGQVQDLFHAASDYLVDHEAYILGLRAAHGKKSSFWSEVTILRANVWATASQDPSQDGSVGESWLPCRRSDI